MSKSKHSTEWKIEIVKKYLSGEGSYARLAEAYGMGEKTLKDLLSDALVISKKESKVTRTKILYA